MFKGIWWHCHPSNANQDHSLCKALTKWMVWPKPEFCPCDCHKGSGVL